MATPAATPKPSAITVNEKDQERSKSKSLNKEPHSKSKSLHKEPIIVEKAAEPVVVVEEKLEPIEQPKKGKKVGKKCASLEHAAKLAEPTSRNYRSLYENFHSILEPNRAARIKRKYDIINKKPLEEIEEILTNELKQQKRQSKKQHAAAASLTNLKAENLNKLFAKICPDILKNIFANDGKKLREFDLSGNGVNLAKCILNDLRGSTLNNHKRKTLTKIEEKTLEILALGIAEWMENLLHEMNTNDNDVYDNDNAQSLSIN